MTRKLLILLAGLFFIFVGFAFIILSLISNKILVIQNKNFLSFSSNLNFLILGKPGPGYIGSENTDSIMVASYDGRNNKLFLVPIPRDLIVKDEKGNLQKINALYEKGKVGLLLKKASDFTGFPVENYFAFDLNLVIRLVDFLGGLEVDLKEPVVDAATGYVIPAGKQKLNGYLVELVLRSRYHPKGDFFRIKNQTEVIRAFKERISNLSAEEKVGLLKFLEKNRYYWRTNLKISDVLALTVKIKDPNRLEVIPIIIYLRTGLLKSGYFNIYNTVNVYGIYPTAGIDNFRYIRNYIQSQVKESEK